MQPKVPKRKGAAAVSQATRAKRRKAEQFGPQAELCRVLPCCVCRRRKNYRRIVASVVIALSVGWYGPESQVSEPHHVVARGMGGVKGKDEDCVGLCKKHHAEVHAIGIETFEAKYGISLAGTASMIAEVRDEHARRTHA